MTDFSSELSKRAEVIEKGFNSISDCKTNSYDLIREAMLYSLTIGGKRIRPIILLEFYKLCGGKDNNAINFAVALEMIHTYSLVHDDLPCMDNDDFRRGKPSCHKAYGEDVAVLAGDALLTEAFALAARTNGVAHENIVKALKELADCAGINGMIGGQIIDIKSEGKPVSIELLKEMYLLKTGALIKSAAKIGCILAGCEDKCEYAEKFAQNIGLAFQIVDDILDVTADEKALGKPVNSDSKNNKSTYLKYLGLEECKKIVVNLTEEAIRFLDNFSGDSTFLKNLATYLVGRNF